MKNPYDLAILATECFGLFTIIILMVSAWFGSSERSTRRKAYMVLLATAFVTELSDAITYLPFNWAAHPSLHFALCLISLITPFFTMLFFMRYLCFHLHQTTKMPRFAYVFGLILMMLGVFCTLYYSFSGMLFTLEDGVYLPGQYYGGYMGLYIVMDIFAVLVILAERKHLGKVATVGALIFELIPIVGVLVSLFHPGVDFGVPSITLSMLIAHTMLQADREEGLVTSEQETNRIAHSDELTGLNNRLAYNRTCESMNGSDPIGVVFSDMNVLKYTNDKFGHQAGDELLQNYAALLQNFYRKDDIYRISGDEFVVLLPGIPHDTFDRKASELGVRLESMDLPIASVGLAYGDQASLPSLIAAAEKEMYARKKVFHQKYPNYERKA